MSRLFRRCGAVFRLLLALLVVQLCVTAHGAEKAEIQASIERAKQFLFSEVNKTGPYGALASYALLKAGVPKDHPDVQKSIKEIMDKCRTEKYVPTAHYNYEAGVDAMLLEAVDRETYKPQLEQIGRFLVDRQRPHGGWYYPNEAGGGSEYGDTSITQYAVLGLWAAVRAGVDIPTETWDKAGRWLMQSQHRDGGFGYHPLESETQAQNQSVSTATMTAAGTGSLLIIRYVLFGDADYDEGVRPAAAPRRYGVLERIPDEKEKIAKPKPKSNPTITAGAIDKALKEGVRWTAEHFAQDHSLNTHENYYYYGIERVAALLDVEKLGTHDWYQEGSDNLLRKQLGNGGWRDSCGDVASTSLTILFLTKATAASLHRPKRAPVVGGGLLVGGRGLPDNLDAVQVKQGEVSTRKLHGPVDGLLAELEKSSGAKVQELQEAVVEAIQLDHPEELIGQVDRLKRLSDDKRVEVRRTAIWALGRSGNVTVAPNLIRGLSDSDEAVVREASTALCILSRRPNGCGLPTDPWEGLSELAGDEERAAHLARWKKGCAKLWNDWYLRVRPYDERDDRNLIRRKP